MLFNEIDYNVYLEFNMYDVAYFLFDRQTVYYDGR